jgi:adenylate cyclase
MAFERYTSREIAQYVLHNPGGELLGGQQKECSILMSDLRGFTALSTRLSPADLIILLNHYFEMMVEVIAKYNGSVIEFLGDGIFVIFGAASLS